MPEAFTAVGSFFWTVLAHQGDAADAELLHRIKEVLDAVFGDGPWVVVGLTVAIILAIPVSIIGLYVLRNRNAETPVDSLTPEEPPPVKK